MIYDVCCDLTERCELLSLRQVTFLSPTLLGCYCFLFVLVLFGFGLLGDIDFFV